MRSINHPAVSGAVIGAMFVPVWVFATYAVVLACGEAPACQAMTSGLILLNPYVQYLRLLGWRFADELPEVPAELLLDDVSVLTVFLINMVIFALLGGGLHWLCAGLWRKRTQA